MKYSQSAVVPGVLYSIGVYTAAVMVWGGGDGKKGEVGLTTLKLLPKGVLCYMGMH